jgi:hypothetical protein
MRERINEDIKTAMKSGDKRRLATLRLVSAAIKDRDLGIGVGDDKKPAGEKVSDQEIHSLLQKMIKQRRESIETFKSAGRNELVEQEEAEITIIESYLPKQMDAEAISAAVASVVKETGAAGLKDMGRVMAALKDRHAGQMDFAQASALVKARLS